MKGKKILLGTVVGILVLAVACLLYTSRCV